MTPVETPKLVLFDIDGTLLHSNGVAMRVYIDALARVFERPVSRAGMDFAGKTDTQIYFEFADRADIPADEADRMRQHFFETFAHALRDRLRIEDITLYPGVHQLLGSLAALPRATVALLTGNTAPTAWLKLTLAGLARYFTFGAFGHEGRRRSDLPPIAVARAEELTGRRHVRKDIIIIGDTPNDIDCGRRVGAKTIAVATGSVPYQELQSHRPDHLFHDLSETRDVLHAIME